MKNQKIKVAHVLHSVGGVDVSLRLIVGYVDSNKFESLIIHGIEDTKTPFLDENAATLKDYKFPISREIRVFQDIRSIRKTITVFRQEKPDIVHAHSAKGGIIARVASIFYNVKVLHTPQAYSYLSEPKGLKRFIFLRAERFFKNINSVLLASSNSERNRGLKEVKYKPAKTLLFNNCIAPISESDLMPHDVELPKKYICTVGRPSFQKNIEMMIEVLKVVSNKNPNIHLVVMGVGEYSPNKEGVEKLIAKHRLENNVTLIPWIERAKIFSIVKNAQLYISTARYEGLPYAIIESLALGKACIVTDCDGNRDLVLDNYNGFVIKDNSVESMANRIFALLNDAELRLKFEENSKNRFNEHFNIENNIELLENIYLKLSKNL